MKLSIQKTVAAVLAVVLTAAVFASCGKKDEPADSLIASETYTEATVQEPEADELTRWVRQILGDENWNGDWSVLTPAQRKALQKLLDENGYEAFVGENGITYYRYTPTANKEEIAEVVKKVLPEKKWDGNYASLSDDEKEAVRAELVDRGYDVDVGKEDFEFKNKLDRKEETTRAEYNQLPTKEILAALIEAELGMEGFKKWDGSFLSLTAKQRASILKQLNDYGYNVGINDKGEMYILHLPQNTMTFDSAYSAAPIGGTTAPSTTILTTQPESEPETENVTGTTAEEKEDAKTLKLSQVKMFGGSGSDLFEYIAATSDGGYIASMRTGSKDGDLADADQTWKQTYAVIVKFDKDFNVQWKGMLGEKSGKTLGVFLPQVAELTDGSFVAVGYTNPISDPGLDAADAIMVKYGADGTRKWVKYLRGTDTDQFECVTAVPDGGYVVGGQSKSADGDFEDLHENCSDAVLIKFRADGSREWIQFVNGGTGATHFVSVAAASNGCIYAACQASCVNHLQNDVAEYAGFGSNDGIVFKFNPKGDFITHRAIAGSGADTITCLTICGGDGVLVGGSTRANSNESSVFAGQKSRGEADAFLVRLDPYLNVQWVKTYGGTGQDVIYAVAQTKDGFVAVGESQSGGSDFSTTSAGSYDGFVLSISGNATSAEKYDLSGNGMDRVRGICVSGKQVTAVGATQSTNGTFTGLKPASDGTNRIGFLATYSAK